MSTPNLAISHIASNQTQKEVTANTAFDNFDDTLTNLVSINMAGGSDVTPTQATVVYAQVLKLTGAITANINLILPAAKHNYIVLNGTTGAFSVTVKTSAGGSTGIATFPGDARYIYSDGTNVMLGHSPLGGNAINVVTVTAAYTVLPLAGHQFILADATTAAFNVTLPDATKVQGCRITIKKKDSSANAVTVVTSPNTQTIDGGSTVALSSQYQKVAVSSDGSEFYEI